MTWLRFVHIRGRSYLSHYKDAIRVTGDCVIHFNNTRSNNLDTISKTLPLASVNGANYVLNSLIG
jgi:hypothetical protein